MFSQQAAWQQGLTGITTDPTTGYQTAHYNDGTAATYNPRAPGSLLDQIVKGVAIVGVSAAAAYGGALALGAVGGAGAGGEAAGAVGDASQGALGAAADAAAPAGVDAAAPGALGALGTGAAPIADTGAGALNDALASQIASQGGGALSSLAPATISDVAPEVAGDAASAAGDIPSSIAITPETVGTNPGGYLGLAGDVPSSVPITPEIAGSNPGGYFGASVGTPSGGALSNAWNWLTSPVGGGGVGAGGGGGGGALSGLVGGAAPSPLSLLQGALSAGSVLAGSNKKPNYGILPGPSSVNQGPLFNSTLPSPSSYLNRTPVTNYRPIGNDWYTWGEHPNQPQFYQNNTIPMAGMARGGALMHALRLGNAGGHGQVSGDGDGTSDSIPARLSNDEYVLTAADVSRIGQGSTAAGVKKLDQMRARIASDAGARKIQGKVKPPLSYLKKAGRR